MKLQNEQLDDFDVLVQSLYQTVYSSEIKGRVIVFPSERSYIKSCNKDYSIAQNKIAEEVISLYELKQQKKAELKKCRQDNPQNKEGIAKLEELSNVISNRIKVLRRLADAIALKVFNNRPWIAKRFVLHVRLQEPDIPAIKSNLEVANQLNKAYPQHFWLVTNLTTYIAVGDLLVRYYTKQTFKWDIIELKIGEINKYLLNLLNSENPPNQEMVAALDSHTAKQLERMIKQKDRTNEILNFINKGKGKDIKTGIPLILNDKEITWKHYDKELRETIEGAKKEQVALCVIDNCLTVFASTLSDKETFHLLYHIVYGGRGCTFEDNWQSDGRHDIRKMNKLLNHYYVKDLILHNMNAASYTPFYNLPIVDVLSDLLFNKMRILLYLDIYEYLGLFHQCGFKIEAFSKRETIYVKNKEANIPLINERAIKLISPNGKAIGLGKGTLCRIFFDVVTPSSTIQTFE